VLHPPYQLPASDLLPNILNAQDVALGIGVERDAVIAFRLRKSLTRLDFGNI
jgi:hypothetical protein